MSVQGIFGHFKAVSMFSSLGHGSRGQHLFLLYVSTLTFICFSPVYVFTLLINSVSVFLEILFN